MKKNFNFNTEDSPDSLCKAIGWTEEEMDDTQDRLMELLKQSNDRECRGSELIKRLHQNFTSEELAVIAYQTLGSASRIIESSDMPSNLPPNVKVIKIDANSKEEALKMIEKLMSGKEGENFNFEDSQEDIDLKDAILKKFL